MSSPSRRRWWLLVAAALAVALAVGVARLRARPPDPASAPQAQRAVPVTVATASRRDVPVYLEGLGNVVASQTVTVRPQVDGRLVSVQFREGQRVRRGEVLAQIDPRPFQAQVQQAQGALARDEAQLRNAQLVVARDRELVAQKLIAQQQLDTDQAALGQLEGAVRMDRAALETARLNVEYARITSPIDGVTGIRTIDPGNVVRAADAGGIVVVTQLDPIAVVFMLPQDQLGPVAARFAEGPLPVDAFSRDGATLLATGQLSVIDNQINQSTSTIRLKALFPNPRRVLWPNQFVNARLHLETRRGALVVPATAITRGASGPVLYAVAADDTAALRPVTLEATEGDLAIVTKGVSDGERVVVEGQNQLRPGAKVAPRAASGPGAAPGGPAAGAPDGATRDGGGAAGSQGGGRAP
jgi:multidrug efflux system membrane fusion protein